MVSPRRLTVHHNGTTELFRWIMRSSTDGLWIFDDDGITTYANDRLAAMLGRTPEETPGLPVADSLDAVGRRQFLEHLELPSGDETGLDNVECALVRKDGTRIWALVNHNPLLDDDGVRRGWLHRVTELTDRKLLLDGLVVGEQQPAEAQATARVGSCAIKDSRMKSEFLAAMSHEISTPLGGVVGLTGQLLKTGLDPEQQRLADGISQAGRTLLGLVNDALDFSKIEAGKLELEIVDFEVRDVVDQVAALVADDARLKSVDLVVACYPDVPRVLRGDPVRVGQIATNLLSNAVKFTSEGQVSMRVTLAGRRGSAPTLRVEVSDTGIGIPAEAQATLFDSLAQADVSTTREYGGTGLGLTISRSLAEALGGEIGFTSKVGAGSTFWFTVPLLPARGQAVEDSVLRSRTSTAVEPAGEPATGASLGVVLVAEDNLVNQMVARGVLEGLGYVVEFAQDGLEAVAAVTATPGRFLAVLMDCQMPRLDGYEATRVIRQLEEPGQRVPVIAMTASTVVGEKERCLDAGMDDFLVKPVDFEVLETTLASWINAGVAPEPPPEGDGLDPFGVLDVNRIRMLQDLRPGDKSFFDRFVETFLARVEDDVEAIETAVAEGAAPRLVAAAHLLKGSAQNLGGSELGRVCQSLEDAGGRGDLTEARGQLPRLTEQVELTLKALRALVSA
jgi:PAS domain S-box-containing protein